ncbi:vegetative cell wall protein gp1-like [Ananas comosus]|uniref:Vegetative cell wall protein gp1-like n=1 Tax=Ananas comosus TaxID=4615 RepID=A0A6P5GTT6_ANACO|nr:vegetative cell wall protein gp1-like [Ananas comosus]
MDRHHPVDALLLTSPPTTTPPTNWRRRRRPIQVRVRTYHLRRHLSSSFRLLFLTPIPNPRFQSLLPPPPFLPPPPSPRAGGGAAAPPATTAWGDDRAPLLSPTTLPRSLPPSPSSDRLRSPYPQSTPIACPIPRIRPPFPSLAVRLAREVSPREFWAAAAVFERARAD